MSPKLHSGFSPLRRVGLGESRPQGHHAGGHIHKKCSSFSLFVDSRYCGQHFLATCRATMLVTRNRFSCCKKYTSLLLFATFKFAKRGGAVRRNEQSQPTCNATLLHDSLPKMLPVLLSLNYHQHGSHATVFRISRDWL